MRWGQWITSLLLAVLSLGMLLPLIVMALNALKGPQDIILPQLFPANPTLDNFREVLANTPALTWFFNSLSFAVLSTLAIVFTSAIAGFIMAKYQFLGRGLIFTIILATAIFPLEIYMIPLYLQARNLGLIDNLGGLVLPYLVMSLGIFLVRQYSTTSIHDSLLEAARVDGATEFWIFRRVALPLLRGPLGVVAVIAFFNAWTAFTWPIIVMLSQNKYTLEVGMALFQTGFTMDYGKISALATLGLIPSVVFFFLARQAFAQGVPLSGDQE